MLDLEAQETSRISWEDYFMHLAEESASRSKDPKTKVGACIVKDKRVLSLGYNGAPRNFPDYKVPSLSNSEDLLKDKNAYMCHAEINAILNFRGSLSELQGAIMYCTLSPCNECMKAIVQGGIKEVVYKSTYHNRKVIEVSSIIARECGLVLRKAGE